MAATYFKVKIEKHTPLTFGNRKVDVFHKDMVGQTILVKEANYEGSPFYECKTGESILKSDCMPIKVELRQAKEKRFSKVYNVKKVRKNSGCVEMTDGTIVNKVEFERNWTYVN